MASAIVGRVNGQRPGATISSSLRNREWTNEGPHRDKTSAKWSQHNLCHFNRITEQGIGGWRWWPRDYSKCFVFINRVMSAHISFILRPPTNVSFHYVTLTHPPPQPAPSHPVCSETILPIIVAPTHAGQTMKMHKWERDRGRAEISTSTSTTTAAAATMIHLKLSFLLINIITWEITVIISAALAPIICAFLHLVAILCNIIIIIDNNDDDDNNICAKFLHFFFIITRFVFYIYVCVYVWISLSVCLAVSISVCLNLPLNLSLSVSVNASTTSTHVIYGDSLFLPTYLSVYHHHIWLA